VLAAVNDKPFGRPQEGPVVDRRCARWPDISAVGAEECLRRGRTAADQLEQHAGFGLILADIGDVVEDQQVILVELGERAFEGEFAARDLQGKRSSGPLSNAGR